MPFLFNVEIIQLISDIKQKGMEYLLIIVIHYTIFLHSVKKDGIIIIGMVIITYTNLMMSYNVHKNLPTIKRLLHIKLRTVLRCVKIAFTTKHT